MTVYLDVVFLENLCMNYIILFATGLINRFETKHIRLLLSSFIGSVYVILSYTTFTGIYVNIILKTMLSIVMVYIAFTPKNMKKLFKTLLIFYLTSFAFGGCAFALLYFIKPQDILMKDGVLVGTYPIKVALLGGIVGFTIIVTAFKIIKNNIRKKDMFCDIEIKFKDKKEIVKAMIDTGNMLKDPISNMPVIVVEAEKLKNILPINIVENINNIISGKYDDIINALNDEEYISKFRIIPFSSIGKQNGLLLGFKAENIKVIYDENERDYRNVIVGIYDKVLSKNNKYNALIGLDMLGEEEREYEYS